MYGLIEVYKDAQFQVSPIKLSIYEEAERFLLGYREAIALYGIRRTGKTTVMQQLWNEHSTEKSRYLYVKEECTMEALLDASLGEGNPDLLFIDEITRVWEIDARIHILLDHCKAFGTKVVLAGTDSYLLSLALRDSAFGRLKLVHCVPIRFVDLRRVRSCSFKDFYLGGKMFEEADQVDLVAENIFHSIDRAMDSNKALLSYLTLDEIRLAIALIVEYVIGIRTNRLPSPKLKFSPRYYSVEELKVFHVGDLPKQSVDTIFHIMQTLDLLIYLDVADPLDGVIKRTEFCCTLPALYLDVLEQYAGEEVAPLLFEAAATAQILAGLRDKHEPRRYRWFKLRSELTGAEVDLCIEDVMEGSISLVEFKLSATKSSRWFDSPEVEAFARKFGKVRKYLVTAEPQEPEVNLGVVKCGIEQFLAGLGKEV